MYSGTKIEMYKGGTFAEEPFTDEQRVQRTNWKGCAQYRFMDRSLSSLILELQHQYNFSEDFNIQVIVGGMLLIF